jgi:hypothetical protein
MPSQPSESDFASFEAPGQRRRLMKFDPTFNTGTIVQIGVIIISAFSVYYTMKQDQALQKQELDFVKASILIERASTKDSLIELKSDVKTLQSSMNAMNESLAVLRGRTQGVK